MQPFLFYRFDKYFVYLLPLFLMGIFWGHLYAIYTSDIPYPECKPEFFAETCESKKISSSCSEDEIEKIGGKGTFVKDIKGGSNGNRIYEITTIVHRQTLRDLVAKIEISPCHRGQSDSFPYPDELDPKHRYLMP